MKNTLFPVKLIGLVDQMKTVWKTDANLLPLGGFDLEGYPADNRLRYPLVTTGVKEYVPLVDAVKIRLAIPRDGVNTIEDLWLVAVELYGYDGKFLASYPLTNLTGAFALAIEVEILTIILGGYGYRVTAE